MKLLERLRYVRSLPSDVKVTIHWHRIILGCLMLGTIALWWVISQKFMSLLLM